MRRREFITLIGGGAVAWPLAAHAQQVMPVVGFLSSQSPNGYTPFAEAFRDGLRGVGFVEGQNVAIEYRWAEGHADRLPALAADLVDRRVAVIAATGGAESGLAAKAVTAATPIVFNTGEDPVKVGLVTSLNRPGGNVTGISWFATEVTAKRVGLLPELAPAATAVALLVDTSNPEGASQPPRAQEAALAIGRPLIVVKASTPDEIDTAFATLLLQGARALVVASGPFFVNRRAQIITLAERHAIPCIFSGRESPAAGGLMSYGNNLPDAYRRNAVYVGRILKGDKPGDLPIDRSAKFELVINLKTAKALALDVPAMLLARADEVIE
jgi:putative tryptophan/tyrosine transport system substrate-binding protein